MKFAHKLALKFGWLDVDAMLSSIPEWKFRRWQLYYSIDPWGEERQDWRFGMLVATYLNSKQRRLAKKFKPSEFMLDFDKREKTPKEMFSMIRNWFDMRSAVQKSSKGRSNKKEKKKPKGMTGR